MNKKNMAKENRKRLKILMMCLNYPSINNQIAGVFYRDHAQAISLFNDVMVICINFIDRQNSLFSKFYQIKHESENSINIIRININLRLAKIKSILALFMLGYVSYCVMKRYRIDAIHAHKIFPSGLVAMLIGKYFGVPFIVTEHSDSFADTMRTWYRKRLIPLVAQKARGIISVSNHLAQSVASIEGQSKIYTIYNPTNFGSNRRYKSTKQHKKTILHISSLAKPQKGIDYLLKAVTKLVEKRDDFVLKIVGGSENNIIHYKTITNNLSLSNVIFLGEISHDEIMSDLINCDFFVLPSLSESFAVVLIEAMAYGKPVIATKCGGPEEIVNSDNGILVPPADVISLSDAIDYMLNNYQKYNSRKIRGYVEKHFSPEVIGKEIDAVYHDVLKN